MGLPRTDAPSALLDAEITPEQLARGRAAEDELQELERRKLEKSAAYYHDRPALFWLECFRWEDGERPTDYQLKNLIRLVKKKRVAVRGPHGLGKTATNAVAVLWFALTRDAAGEDWKVITTASAWRQLTHFLWPEIKKWAKRLDWDKLGREPFTDKELLQLQLRLEHGEAFAVACENAATIEGAHADQMFYIYDEAKTIPAETFDASEGAFSGAGEDTKNEAYALASSTPGEPQGRFYEIHVRKEGLHDWTPVHVTLEEAQAAKRVSKDWARERMKQWGESSAIYINRVLGNFAASEEDGVISLASIERANQRWLELRDAGWKGLEPLDVIGADIARSGGDKTVLAMRHGNVIRGLEKLPRQDTMRTTGTIKAKLKPLSEGVRTAVIDVIGIGAGVVDRLREQGCNVVAFNASEKSTYVDRSKELEFVNQRAAAWWNLRDMLLEDSGEEIALPPDDRLTGDLLAPKWKITSGGKVQIESKEDIKKRIGRSTDYADAVIHAFADKMRPPARAPILQTGAGRFGELQRAGERP